ncbi:paraquat-inducible protein A [Paraferrimonas haliotis]|uniref:PqiA family protein n=1 Tax=Paraferrimonas haliotis TaxID=2013866 RepID=A0AA37WZ94_9GAMM|nr:paraquat-inducible protein A [Paraferrimonas haliotis]GLS84635.1 PqiA family protein [Paraferrimonas haliotis]
MIEQQQSAGEDDIGNFVLCKSCDRVMEKPLLQDNQRAFCPRCKTRVFDPPNCPMNMLLALTIAALVMYFPANFLPILEVHFFGSIRQTTITGGALSVIEQGYWLVGVSVLLCAVIAPGLLILSLLAQVIVIGRSQKLSPLRKSILLNLLRMHGLLTQFTMLEIYLISFLVSVFKLTDFSDVYYGVGTWSFVILYIVLFYAQREYVAEVFWRRYHDQYN